MARIFLVSILRTVPSWHHRAPDNNTPLALLGFGLHLIEADMKVRNSLRSLAKRDRNNRIVRRRGRLYVINKKNPKFKARQG